MLLTFGDIKRAYIIAADIIIAGDDERADALSRAYVEDETDCGFIEVIVHSLTQNFPRSSQRLEQFRSVTADDATLQRLYQVVMKVRTRTCETIGTCEVK